MKEAENNTGIPEPGVTAGQTEEDASLPHDHGLTEPDPTIMSLKAELVESHRKITELNANIMRAHAEYQNLQKRAERDVVSAHRYAIERFLGELIPVLDSLEQTYVGIQGGQNGLQEGVTLTLKLMTETLKKYGVEAIDPAHQMFDPNFHEAMTLQENQEVPSNTVLSVFQKGYLLNGRLVRPARVVVSKNSTETA